ncbi:hypothetical protein BJV78DRAFT_1221218 [Lactifluus subvellereus]|nr:hypothetical protein BJV78DRAFT_1221218 [Lactifluus subvellereus]
MSTNNEVSATRNATYAAHLLELDALMPRARALHVVPNESSWFGSYAAPEDEDGDGIDRMRIVSMREQPLYAEDWIGLRGLDESGRVVLVSCDSEHIVCRRGAGSRL